MLNRLKSNTAMLEGVSRDAIVGWSSIEGCSRRDGEVLSAQTPLLFFLVAPSCLEAPPNMVHSIFMLTFFPGITTAPIRMPQKAGRR